MFLKINYYLDQGKLWENYMISELKKKNSYTDNYCWRLINAYKEKLYTFFQYRQKKVAPKN